MQDINKPINQPINAKQKQKPGIQKPAKGENRKKDARIHIRTHETGWTRSEDEDWCKRKRERQSIKKGEEKGKKRRNRNEPSSQHLKYVHPFTLRPLPL